MNKQELHALLQAHVDFTISDDVFELVEHNSGLDITSENSLLILDEIRKQHEVSKLLQSAKVEYSDDQNTFIAETLKKIKPQRNIKSAFNIYSGIRVLSLGLTVCFCVLIFTPFMKTEVNEFVANNTNIDINNDYSDIIVTSKVRGYLESIDPYGSPTYIMQAEEFGQDDIKHYLSNVTTCLDCQSQEKNF